MSEPSEVLSPTREDSSSAKVPSEIPASSKAVLDLLDTQEWLRNQLLDYKTQVAASKDDSPLSSDDPEVILERMKELKSNLQEAHTDHMLQDLMLKRLQQGLTLIKHLFPEKLTAGGDATAVDETEQHKILSDLVEKQSALASEVLKTHKANQEKRIQVASLKKDNLELTHTVRELMFNLQKEKDAQAQRQHEESQDETLKSAEEDLRKIREKTELVRHIFQGLILGSGVDWAEDKELTELLLSLGKPLDDQL